MVVYGSHSEILYANPRALELLRLTAGQALGKQAFDPDWRFLDEHKRLMPVAQYPVSRVLGKETAVTNQVLGTEPPHDTIIDRVFEVVGSDEPEPSFHAGVGFV